MNEKFKTLEEAVQFAEIASREYSQTIYVIEASGEFFADDLGQVKAWETLHCTFKNGKQLIEK